MTHEQEGDDSIPDAYHREKFPTKFPSFDKEMPVRCELFINKTSLELTVPKGEKHIAKSWAVPAENLKKYRNPDNRWSEDRRFGNIMTLSGIVLEIK